AALRVGQTSGPPNGVADPPGEHLVVLAEGPVGDARLARAISEGQMAGEKGAARFTLAGLAAASRVCVHLTGNRASVTNDSWHVLTGCRKGPLARALHAD